MKRTRTPFSYQQIWQHDTKRCSTYFYKILYNVPQRIINIKLSSCIQNKLASRVNQIIFSNNNILCLIGMLIGTI